MARDVEQLADRPAGRASTERMINRESAWPRVVIRPVLAPCIWMIALVPTAVPVKQQRRRGDQIAERYAEALGVDFESIEKAACKVSSGVEGLFAIVTRPCSSITTQSVNVPPVSIEQKYFIANRSISLFRRAIELRSAARRRVLS
jgi:hypothetical protein